MALVSQDIFYEVKKEILDKLDVILQKINLEIINYIKPEEDEFAFIELSCFQTQITQLFTYLDRLYASLNSSVSFSSVQSYKESAENYQAQNQRLTTQNLKLKQIIDQINFNQPSKYSQPVNPSEIELLSIVRAETLVKLQPLKLKIKALSMDLSSLGKIMKKVLKSYKFEMLESRVEIISRLKDWSQDTREGKKQLIERQCETDLYDHSHFDAHEVIEALDQIISIC